MTTLKDGEILMSKYVAPNGMVVLSFYKIVSINGRKLTLARLNQKHEYSSDRSGMATPGDRVTDTLMINWSGYPGVRINNIEVAQLWDGKPVPFYV